MKKYIKLWWILTSRTTQIAFTSRVSALLFLLGKLLRYVSFLFFIFILISRTKTIAGYSLWQMMFFFLTFNLIDTTAQLFLREVYRFRSQIVSGYFDYILTKPIATLYKVLFGGSDVLDLPILLLTIIGCVYIGMHLGTISFINFLIYFLLIVNSFFIAISFHIFVLSLGILTTEIDNAIMLYRDLTQMGRVPIDIYKEPLRGFLTFIIPIGIMMTFPAKAIMGILSWNSVIIALSIGLLLFVISIQFWKFALKNYSSASS